MSSPNTLGDPRSGRDRRVPTKTRAFKHGHIDPVTSHKRPLLTVGNILLLIVGVGYGMYATGNLPQLDAFFDHADQVGKAHNSAVVNTLITYGTIIFGGVLVALFCLMVFLFFNSRRREHVDGKGWHKVANAPTERRSRSRRTTADMPSLVMPLGKERPTRRTTDNIPATPDVVPAPIVAKTEPAPPAITLAASQPATPPKPETVTPAPSAAKAEAMAAAAKAEAAIATTPIDPPSFVRAPKFKVETAPPVIATPVATTKPEPPTVVTPSTTTPDASLLTANAANAKAEAAIAEAKAIAARAEATLAAAKLEALIATAKAEAAAAEAAVAAAKAASLTT